MKSKQYLAKPKIEFEFKNNRKFKVKLISNNMVYNKKVKDKL